MEVIRVLEVRKTVKLRVVGDNENQRELEKLLAIWRLSVWQKRKRDKH